MRTETTQSGLSAGGRVKGASDVVVVGGPAGDDEILEILGGHAPRSAFGRANVAGILGHRWAVAYGLTMTDPD